MLRFALSVWVIVFLFVFPLACRAQDKKPQEVSIGAYLKNIESIDVASNTYYLDLVLWLRWKGPIDPTKGLDIANVIDRWGLTMTPASEEPEVLEDGSSYQRYDIEGRFYHKFWLGTFPLDWQKIVIEVENTSHASDELVFVPDPESSTKGIDENLTLPDWRIVEVYNQEKKVAHASTYGRPGEDSKPVSHYRFGVRVQRPAGFFLLKVAPPMIAVLITSLLVFFMNAEYENTRMCVVTGALLTLVFLQLTFSDALPSVGIHVLLDEIFNYSYLILFLIAVECVCVTRLFDRRTGLEEEAEEGSEEEKGVLAAEIQALTARMEMFDRLSRWVFPVAHFAGCMLIALYMRGFELFHALTIF